jgi:hypothetical protein
MDVHQWLIVRFLTVSIERNYEPNLETEPNDGASHRRFNPAETRLPGVLASVCSFAFFSWSQFSDLSDISTSLNRGAAQSSSGSTRFQGKRAPWLRAISTRLRCHSCCSARQICVGFKTHHVQRIRVAPSHFVVECMAAFRYHFPSNNVPQLGSERILMNSNSRRTL